MKNKPTFGRLELVQAKKQIDEGIKLDDNTTQAILQSWVLEKERKQRWKNRLLSVIKIMFIITIIAGIVVASDLTGFTNINITGTMNATQYIEAGSTTLSNNISGNAATADTATTATTANSGDSATAFFDTGIIEDARLDFTLQDAVTDGGCTDCITNAMVSDTLTASYATTAGDADTLDSIDSSRILVQGTDIPGSADLDDYTTTGLYHQNTNANAASGSNYPEVHAGILEVIEDGSMVYQRYTSYQAYGIVWHREKYTTTWSAWARFYDSADVPGGDLGGTWATPSVDDDSHNHIYSNIDATTSANWATVISDETGTGNIVFSTSPTLTTPAITGDWNTMTIKGTGATGGFELSGSDGVADGYVYGESTNVGFLDDDGAWGIRHDTDTASYFYVNGALEMTIAPTVTTITDALTAGGKVTGLSLATTGGDVVLKDVAPEVTWIETDQANDEWRMIVSATNMYLEPETTDNTFLIRNQANANVLTINTGTKAAVFSGAITTSTDLTVTDDLFVNDFARTDALRVGTTSTDPGDGNLYVEGDLTVSGESNVGQWTYVETITPSASSYITVDNIDSSWRQVKVVLTDVKSTSDSQTFYTQFSTTNAASWITSADYAYSYMKTWEGGSSVIEDSAYSHTGSTLVSGVGNAGPESLNGEIIIWNPGSSTTACEVTTSLTYRDNSGSMHRVLGNAGLDDSVVSDIDAVRFYFGGGNTVASGTVHVYRSTHN